MDLPPQFYEPELVLYRQEEFGAKILEGKHLIGQDLKSGKDLSQRRIKSRSRTFHFVAYFCSPGSTYHPPLLSTRF